MCLGSGREQGSCLRACAVCLGGEHEEQGSSLRACAVFLGGGREQGSSLRACAVCLGGGREQGSSLRAGSRGAGQSHRDDVHDRRLQGSWTRLIIIMSCPFGVFM